MKLKHWVAGFGLGALAINAQADFMVDLDLSLATGSGEYTSDAYDDLDVDQDSTTLAGTIYFGRVGSAAAPYREAGFLSRQSSASVIRYSQEVEYSQNVYSSKYKSDATGIGGRFVISGPDLILIAALVKGDDDDIESDSRMLGTGVYINKQGALTLTYTVTEREDKTYSEYGIDDSKDINVNFRQVMATGSRGHLAVYFNAGRYDDGFDYDDTHFGGGATWYPSQKFGVGARLSVISGSSGNSDVTTAVFTPHISFDFSENVGLYAELDSTASEFSYDDYEDEELSLVDLTMGVNVRF